ncbi:MULTISPECIES: cytochrome c [unclassified Neisseria]|uniref:c-type cytochrome n=1 Tax=unclassified Neisseria TaxID=2623750 RepID=UPI0010720594|nr:MULTISPECIES: cytochrome c [unclassified Neisseria]MBF0804602.1 cytochrome c [Neisseria sp. 19428wB4_WF04]TFU40392.1 cytochrome c [Neisseria sp. WF04]
MKKTVLTLGTLAALSLLAACGGQNSSAAPAAPAPETAQAAASGSASGPEEAVKEREKLMKSFKEDVGTMGKMVKGETPYDAAAFQAAADSLATNADKPWEHYTPESANEESEAKPEVWSKPDEFKQAVETFTTAAAALKTAAASGKLDDVKKPFGEVGRSCKACHDTFRAD